MTSINAIRFNRYEGACICDESITSGDEMRLDVSDKIQPVIPRTIVERYGTVAALGTTGSCSVGEEVKQTFSSRLAEMYDKEVERHGRPPTSFPGLAGMGPIVFDILVEMKYRALSRRFIGEHGFALREFFQGKYERRGTSVEIKDKDVIRELTALLTFKYQQPEVSYVFNNAVLLAGYDDERGMQMMHFDLRAGYWHTVQTCYMAEGSGRHSVDPAMYAFVESLHYTNRRENVDRVEGLVALMSGVNSAIDHEIGVGGYPSIVLIDGRQKDHRRRMREINDERSLLGSQIVRALNRTFIDRAVACELVEELFYGEGTFEEVFERFFSKARNPKAISRLLRGYKIMPHREELVYEQSPAL